jgi:soluble lytic murein transglycosylase-like protein
LSGREKHLAGAIKAAPYLIALAVLAVPAPARAQIYSWRDANGQLVVSNIRPAQPAAVKSYAVPKSPTIRATRFAAAERSRLYDDLISEHAQLNGVRTDLVRAVVQVESAFNPNARSPKGALGLMQLMPSTAQQYGVTNPYNPIENVRAGVQYLRGLLERFENNEELALAAYNAGPRAVDKYGNTVPPYRETRNYVAQINKMAARPIEVRGTQLYKVSEVVDGRVIPRYTNTKPKSGPYEVVSAR